MVINKSNRHSHFWVEGCQLFESYNTIRGMRYHFICEILWPDSNFLNDAEMEAIEKILNGVELAHILNLWQYVAGRKKP